MAGDGHAGTWVVVYVGVRAQNPRDSGGDSGVDSWGFRGDSAWDSWGFRGFPVVFSGIPWFLAVLECLRVGTAAIVKTIATPKRKPRFPVPWPPTTTGLPHPENP